MLGCFYLFKKKEVKDVSTMVNVKSGEYVTIGDVLGQTETYLGDVETTFEEDGKIYASAAGYVRINEKDRRIKVETGNERKRIIPRKGDIIIGEVSVIRKTSVGLKIRKLNQKYTLDRGIYANIHISQASKQYVQNLDEVLAKTDILRAKIVGLRGKEYRLATDENNTGVIFSQCKYCSTPMNRKGRDQVICPFCGNMERKVLAPDYGEIKEVAFF